MNTTDLPAQCPMTDAEMDAHIKSCSDHFLAAYQRFEDFGLPADRDAEENQTLRIVHHIGTLCDSIATGHPIDHISDAMGRVAIDMIVLCAMLDIDLAKSMETAFNKISAKPVDTSNVVLLKRE